VHRRGKLCYLQLPNSIALLLAAAAAGVLPLITVEDEEEVFSISEYSTEGEVSDTEQAAAMRQSAERVTDTETIGGPPVSPVSEVPAVESAAMASGSGSQNTLMLPQTAAEQDDEADVIRKGGMTVAIARSFVVSTASQPASRILLPTY